MNNQINCIPQPDKDNFRCSCDRCGFTIERRSPTMVHECHPAACIWEPIGKEFRCNACGIVLPERTVRRCQKLAGMQGLGDLVHRVAEAIGVEQKEGCGCGKTQEMLNELLPFKSKEKGEQE